MNPCVHVETRVGGGTSVKVFLPRAGVAVGDHERESVDAEQRPPMKRKSSVLVADDDKTVLKSTLRMLDFLGFAGVPAESGGEALRLIATKPDIGLVLADFAMPEMNGVELARAVHATRPTLPVILVTGYCDHDLLKEFGDSRILQKPYTEGDLVDKIAAALN